MNKDEIKDIIYRLILCFVIVLFLFLLLLTIYSILDTLKNKNENWISFWGAIIGGSLTLLGVWWTIKDINNERIIKTKDVDRPIIDMHIMSTDKLDGTSIENDFAFRYTLKNIGKISAKNIDVNYTKPNGDKFESGTESKFTANILFPEQKLDNYSLIGNLNNSSVMQVLFTCSYENGIESKIKYITKYTFQIYDNGQCETVKIEHTSS